MAGGHAGAAREPPGCGARGIVIAAAKRGVAGRSMGAYASAGGRVTGRRDGTTPGSARGGRGVSLPGGRVADPVLPCRPSAAEGLLAGAERAFAERCSLRRAIGQPSNPFQERTPGCRGGGDAKAPMGQ